MVLVIGVGFLCSLFSNVLERGYGIMFYIDYFYVCNVVKVYIFYLDLCK